MAGDLRTSFNTGAGPKIVSNMGMGGGGAARKLSPEEQARAYANSLAGRREAVDKEFAAIRGMLGRQESGEDAPFSQATIARLLAQQADQGASTFATNRRQIAQGFGRFGAGGSGGQIAAEAAAARQAAKLTGQGQRDVNVRTSVENYGARERARAQLMQLLGQLAAWNSRFEVTGQSPLAGVGGGGGGGVDPNLAAVLRALVNREQPTLPQAQPTQQADPYANVPPRQPAQSPRPAGYSPTTYSPTPSQAGASGADQAIYGAPSVQSGTSSAFDKSPSASSISNLNILAPLYQQPKAPTQTLASNFTYNPSIR